MQTYFAKAMPPIVHMNTRRHDLCELFPHFPSATVANSDHYLVTESRQLRIPMKKAHTNGVERSNRALDRTGDAGHKACGASFAPKAHRFPRSATGGARRSGHRQRYVNPRSGFTRDFTIPNNRTS